MNIDPKKDSDPGTFEEMRSIAQYRSAMQSGGDTRETVYLSLKPTAVEGSTDAEQLEETANKIESHYGELNSKNTESNATHAASDYRSDMRDQLSAVDFSVNHPTEVYRRDDETSDAGKAVSLQVPANIPRVIGGYEIKRVLGRGGMGIVYLAHQQSLKRDVALKMVLAGNLASESQLELFKAEACAVAKLQHPSIVQVFEVGEHETMPYFSLEYVEGPSLDSLLDNKPIAARDAAALTEKICRAMQYAHNRGILHRDLKPANILTTRSGEPKISDFGLAKQLDDEESAMTRTGTVMGTPSYMSPEQAQGLSNSLTHASDQYSVGAILYELLTGRAPFVGTKAYDTLSQVVHKEPVPPCHLQPDLASDIDTICLKALQKDPQKRYSSCDAMADDLARFLRGEPILARPVGLPERFWRWCKRNPLVAIPSASAVALLIASATVSTWAFVQISAQAGMIAQERDNVKVQRDDAEAQRALAQQNEKKAKVQQEKAVREREEAERQRLLANEARLQAEKNQQLAERQALLALQNIQLVVTEVDDQLAKEPGMSDIRISVLEILEKKWDELDLALAGGVQGEAIPTLMAVRAKIADVWGSVDRIAQSNAQYEKVYQQAQDRTLVKNRSDASRFNLALICVRWAPIKQRVTGDPLASESLLSEAITVLREILEDPRPEPGSPKPFQIADALQQALMRSATASMKIGSRNAAESRYREASEIGKQVLQEIFEDAAWYRKIPEASRDGIRNYFEQGRDLANAGLANLMCRMNRVNEAVTVYEQIIDTRRKNVEALPQDRNSRDQLALQLRNYGQYMLKLGRIQDAVRLIGQAHDLTEKNLAEDPENAQFKRSHGHSLYYWAVAREEVGQVKDAIVLLDRSKVLRSELVEASPDQANKVNLMLSLGRLGDVERAKLLIDELSQSEKSDPDLRLDIARALAQLCKHGSNPLSRNEFIDSALRNLAQSIDEGLVDPFAITSEVDLKPIHDDARTKDLVKRLSEQ